MELDNSAGKPSWEEGRGNTPAASPFQKSGVPGVITANADQLVAMATRRESSLARGVLGSVIDMTSLPLLALHPEDVSAFSGNSGAPGTLVVPLDGSELSEKAVPVAHSVAQTIGAKILHSIFCDALLWLFRGRGGLHADQLRYDRDSAGCLAVLAALRKERRGS